MAAPSRRVPAALPYPNPVSDEVTRRMKANRRRDTKPERVVRSELHRRGLRFRKDHPVRTPERLVRVDVAFTRARLAIFVDGCFWHRCPVHGTEPARNSSYWTPKLDRNVARDRAVDAALLAEGWTVLRFWEHEEAVPVADAVAGELGYASSVHGNMWGPPNL